MAKVQVLAITAPSAHRNNCMNSIVCEYDRRELMAILQVFGIQPNLPIEITV